MCVLAKSSNRIYLMTQAMYFENVRPRPAVLQVGNGDAPRISIYTQDMIEQLCRLPSSARRVSMACSFPKHHRIVQLF